MDPLMAMALIQGGSTLLGGLMGGGAARDAADVNADIAAFNMKQGQVGGLLQMMLAERARRAAELGTTDIYGTRTHTIPGVGTVTEASPAVGQLMRLGQDAQLQDATVGEQTRRALAEREAGAAMRESGYADRLFSQMERETTPDARDERLRPLAPTMAAYNIGSNQALDKAALLANRTGGGPIDLTSNMAEKAGQQFATTMAGLPTTGGQRNVLPATSNLYTAMRSRLRGPGATVPQINVPQGGDVAGAAARLTEVGAGPTRTVDVPMFSPDMTGANLVRDLGSIGAGYLQGQIAQQQNNQMTQLLNDYLRRQGGGTSTSTGWSRPSTGWAAGGTSYR